MATEPLIYWNAIQHVHREKKPDWYWAVGIITLALVVVAFIFGQIITAILILVSVIALVIHASKVEDPSHCEINDRGIMVGELFYPFLSIDSFCIPHESDIPKILIKSLKPVTPLIVIYIDEIDPEQVRSVLLKYIAETEHHESIFKLLLERFGF